MRFIKFFSPTPRHPTSGTSSLEVVVAFSLLTTVLAVTSPLIVRHGRMLSQYSDYRLALDELSNQLDRLTAIPEPELPEAIEQLVPSPFASASLPDADLDGALEAAEFGQRITLRLSWDEPGRRSAPVSMTAWVLPEP